jgi:hypothetical protein
MENSWRFPSDSKNAVAAIPGGQTFLSVSKCGQERDWQKWDRQKWDKEWDRQECLSSCSRNCWLAAILVGSMLPLLFGCGEKLSKVAATVTLDGRPLAAASVMLQPVGKGLPAVGATDAEGCCQFETGNKKGVEPGDYRVIVIKRAIVGAQPTKSGLDEGVAPGVVEERSLIPTKYADPNTSGFTVHVKPGDSIAVDFALKSGR